MLKVGGTIFTKNIIVYNPDCSVDMYRTRENFYNKILKTDSTHARNVTWVYENITESTYLEYIALILGCFDLLGSLIIRYSPYIPSESLVRQYKAMGFKQVYFVDGIYSFRDLNTPADAVYADNMLFTYANAYTAIMKDVNEKARQPIKVAINLTFADDTYGCEVKDLDNSKVVKGYFVDDYDAQAQHIMYTPAKKLYDRFNVSDKILKEHVAIVKRSCDYCVPSAIIYVPRVNKFGRVKEAAASLRELGVENVYLYVSYMTPQGVYITSDTIDGIYAGLSTSFCTRFALHNHYGDIPYTLLRLK